MGWQRYFLHDFFTAKEFDRLEQRIKNTSREKRAGERRINAGVDRLKDDLGRAYLMISALTELCLRKGVISEEELNQVLHEVDVSDGVEDGQLNASSSPSDEATTPEQFLRELEREDL